MGCASGCVLFICLIALLPTLPGWVVWPFAGLVFACFVVGFLKLR